MSTEPVAERQPEEAEHRSDGNPAFRFHGLPGEPVRYLLFSAPLNVTRGGWRDALAAFTSQDAAMLMVASIPWDHWVELIDLSALQPIYQHEGSTSAKIENPFASTIEGEAVG